mmetsp:Transcript_4643/g.8822  ORF Transcript_4643/g.8822 Transcript_4643/m.8822 type:complete len:89 (-) Transcript_4643:1887-2153(-)
MELQIPLAEAGFLLPSWVAAERPPAEEELLRAGEFRQVGVESRPGEKGFRQVGEGFRQRQEAAGFQPPGEGYHQVAGELTPRSGPKGS